MKRIPFLILLLAVSIAFTLPPERKVEWISDTRHDFGILTHKVPEEHHFTFKNISDEPLTIDNVRTSCGCTAPKFEDEVVLPDSIGTITLEYNSFKIGYFQKVAKVYFSGQKKAERLIIEGEVVEITN